MVFISNGIACPRCHVHVFMITLQRKNYKKKILNLNNSTMNTLKKGKFELDIINDFLPIQSFYLRVFNYETVMIF